MFPRTTDLGLKLRQDAAENNMVALVSTPALVDINASGAASKKTALHRAAENGSFDALQILLNRGANFDLVDSAGNTPAQLATDPRTKLFFLLHTLALHTISAVKTFYTENPLIGSVPEKLERVRARAHKKYESYKNRELLGPLARLLGGIQISESGFVKQIHWFEYQIDTLLFFARSKCS